MESEERREDVEEAFGSGLELLPLELRVMLVNEILERAGASGETRDTVLSIVSTEMKKAVDNFLAGKRGKVIHGALLRTEARYMLFASPRWKLITSLSLEVTKKIIRAAYLTRLKLDKDARILFIGKDDGHWREVVGMSPTIEDEVATFISLMRGHLTRVVIKGNEAGGTDVSLSGNDFSLTFLYSLVSKPWHLSAYVADNRNFWEFLPVFLNLKTKKGYGPEAHPLKEGINRVVIVRFESIEGGEDIDGELRRIEEDIDNIYDDKYLNWDHLREDPWNYSFSSYISPIVDPSRERSGLLILPDPIFYTFLVLEVGRIEPEKLSLRFGDIIVKLDHDYTSYEIGSNSIISHQPYDIIFLTDDMPLEEVEKIGIVQKEREERAKTKLITW